VNRVLGRLWHNLTPAQKHPYEAATDDYRRRLQDFNSRGRRAASSDPTAGVPQRPPVSGSLPDGVRAAVMAGVAAAQAAEPDMPLASAADAPRPRRRCRRLVRNTTLPATAMPGTPAAAQAGGLGGQGQASAEGSQALDLPSWCTSLNLDFDFDADALIFVSD
jgi:hypothetical protein